ncbi:PREDICTED: cytochrome c oxidase assembly factor 3 homolog, mitochondrial [Nanorana parkeri]|uniref:cytochrome c oxidase assembly factor 3 homolog, mitochondrial n=1 Tax=Nanorana parkeri TaxID=125878 RepID=UPI000854424A|nr:PREDICTED: cytochrome c oxidase assembly factor 3 homolog, mitochondrial [Nanorana parkeri]
MVEQRSEAGSDPKYAEKIDQTKLTREQQEFIRRKEMSQWLKNSGKLRTRNGITALAIGGIVLGIYGYTFYSVSQEKFLDELENEAKEARARYPKTSAN